MVAFSRERERERERESRSPRHITYNTIISLENLLISWQEFLRGKRNRKDVLEFSVKFMDNIFNLHDELANKKYQHGSYHAFKINDPKPRDIHKANVRDRIVHHAIYKILCPYFDSKFIYDSYSCRVDKGSHKAINRFTDMARKVSVNNTKTIWVLKCDIKKFFASIDHGVLKDISRRFIKDNDIIQLLERIIDSFHTENNVNIGLPLGNVTSQIFINIYLNEFDQFIKRDLKIRYYIRYADDFVILDTNRAYLIKLIPKISKYLEKELKLTLHPKKVFIKTLSSGIDFLGWVHFPYHRVLRASAKRRIFKKLKGKVDSESFNQSLQSYLGYLKHGNSYKLTQQIKKEFF